MTTECRRCGTCCTAPDISTLGKPAAVRCRHLDGENLCSAYADRPPVCSGYRPDEICDLIDAPTLEERVAAYLALFGMTRSEETPSGHDRSRSTPSSNSP
jgi:uncharacterized protein